MKDSLPPWYEEVLQELSVERVMEDVRWLVENAPHRLSGTDDAEKAACYLADRLRGEGIDGVLDEVPGYLSIPGPAALDVLGPAPRSFEVRTFAHSGSTGEGGVEGELIHLGAGGEADYEGVDVAGKVVLVELSYAPPRPEKVRIAQAKGAVGVVMMNWGLDDSEVLPYGTCKPVWGNPRPQDMHLMPALPAIGISRRDGIELKNLLGQGTVRVRLKSEATRDWYTMLQPRAVIRSGKEEAQQGGPRDKDFLLLCGHMDSWPIGATDNAAGNAAVLEVARVLQKHRERLERDVWIAFWQGHENGIMAGSTWFVDNFWDELKRSIVGHINLDTPGMEDSSVWRANSSAELIPFHKSIEKQLIPEYPTVRGRVPRTGDQSFFGLGVPSISARTMHTEEQIAGWHGATLGWWYHSEEDTMERIDRALLDTALHMTGAHALGLATARVLPYDFRPAAEEVLNRLEQLGEGLVGREELAAALDLAGVESAARSLADTAARVAEARERVLERADEGEQRRWNEALKRASRALTHAKYTVGGVYDQDPYGLSATANELPGLAPLPRLATMAEDDPQFYPLYTEVRRQRNRVKDALDEARHVLSQLVEEGRS